MSGELAQMTAERFEDAMERSFLIWLQDNLPSLTISTDGGNLTIPIQVLAAMPHEYFLKNRGDNILVEVCFKRKRTEAYTLGQSFGHYRAADGDDEPYERSVPWRYIIPTEINVYTSSGSARAKMDGKLRDLFQGFRSGYSSCPVYEWLTDTSMVSAFNTGAFISVFDHSDEENIHSEDPANFDYLSHWMVELKCPYVIDTRTELVTSFNITTQIQNLT